MSANLEPIGFDPATFEKELDAFEALLKSKTELAETKDIQPFFENNKHLSAYLGTFSPDIGPATDLGFQFPFFGDYKADLVLGNKKEGAFCVVEFEDGCDDSIFKIQPTRNNPEWSSRFEHGISQIIDWFFNLDDYKKTHGFTKQFGTGHIRFTGLLIIGRDASLDDMKRTRLKWRTEKVLVDSHPVNCITFDALHALLKNRFRLYRAASKLEKKPGKK